MTLFYTAIVPALFLVDHGGGMIPWCVDDFIHIKTLILYLQAAVGADWRAVLVAATLMCCSGKIKNKKCMHFSWMLRLFAVLLAAAQASTWCSPVGKVMKLVPAAWYEVRCI